MTVKQECICQDNHGYSPSTPPEDAIGRHVGYGAFSLFVANGGYEEEQSVLDQVEDTSTEFQTNEHDPLQSEADSINTYLRAVHEIGEGDCPYCGTPHDTVVEYRAERNAKIARLLEIDAEITWKWVGLRDVCRDLISDEGYSDYLAAIQ